MDIGKIIYLVANFVRHLFGAIFQAAFGIASLVGMNWLWSYAYDHVLITDMNLMLNLICYIFIPCYIIIFFMSDWKEYNKNEISKGKSL